MKKLLLIVPALCLTVAANAQWNSQATGFPNVSSGVFDVDAVDANTAWAIAYDGSGGGGVFQDFTRTTNGGTTWTAGVVTAAPATTSFSDICAVDGMTAWTAMWHAAGGGAIYKTTDGGATWNAQTTATFAAPGGFPDVIHFWNANNGYCMGDPNGGYFEIYTTTDGGTTWTRTPQANIPAPLSGEYGYTNVHDVEGSTIWFGTNKGRIYKSIDGGLNWTVAVCETTAFSIGDVVFRSQSIGLVYAYNTTAPTTWLLKKSTDGGATWTTITPGGTYGTSDLENIPVAGSLTFVTTGAAAGNESSNYSVDDGANWVSIDATVQHTAQAWANGTVGWCGGFTTSPTADGIFKYSGMNLGVEAVNRPDARMRIYPNPTNGQFTVQIGGAEKADATIKVTDITGKVVYQMSVANSSILIEKNINLSNVAKGVYFVNVQNGSTKFTDKLIIE